MVKIWEVLILRRFSLECIMYILTCLQSKTVTVESWLCQRLHFAVYKLEFTSQHDVVWRFPIYSKFCYSTNSAFYSWAHTTQWTLRFTLILKRYFALKTATILSLSLHENADYSICVCIASISSLGSFTIQKIKNENEVCIA